MNRDELLTKFEESSHNLRMIRSGLVGLIHPISQMQAVHDYEFYREQVIKLIPEKVVVTDKKDTADYIKR